MMHGTGLSRSARVEGVAPFSGSLDGLGFTLALTAAAGGVDVAVDGAAAPEQVLRLLAQSGVLAGRKDLIQVRIDTAGGYDEYTYTRDLRHRVLFRRAWDRPGRVGVFYGLNPFVGDTDGSTGEVPGRPSLRNVVAVLSQEGPLARIDIMNLFTFRSPDAASLPARAEDRVAVPELERAVLADADVVLLAWGSKVGDRHRAAVEQLLAVLEDVGVAPSMLSRNGKLLTVGQPPQPAHPARIGYRGLRAVPVDASTVLGQRPPATVGVAPPSTVVLAATLEPEPARPRERAADTSGAPHTNIREVNVSATSTQQAQAWFEAHLDALGREALRRLLAGEQHAPPHPEVPEPEELLRRAHEAGGPQDALDLAVAAHRITSGIAWRWIGARYLLVNCNLSPDLEDRRADGKKVTGSPYAQAARAAISRLAPSSTAVGNDLAPGNAPRLSFAELARRWNVSDDLIGATLGPGASRWMEPIATRLVGEQGGVNYYRAVAEHAAWTRDGG